jgi:hypothetical protein
LQSELSGLPEMSFDGHKIENFDQKILGEGVGQKQKFRNAAAKVYERIDALIQQFKMEILKV